MRDIGSRDAIDKTAAMVVGQGIRYNPLKNTNHKESKIQPPIRNGKNGWFDLTGIKSGKLTIIGLSIDPSRSCGATWVARCSCGTYCYRKAKSINNIHNYDECSECYELSRMKAKEYCKLTGKYPNE